MRAGILDYGVGNLFSLRTALKRYGATPQIARTLGALHEVDVVLLPGVGNFTPVAEALRREWRAFAELLARAVPVLGICLGLQVLFERSAEGPGRGLGHFGGRVVRLPDSVKVPQIGWNTLRVVRADALLDGLPDAPWVYYVHSYYPQPADASVVLADSEYGVTVPAVLGRGRVYGTQFHPEKSGDTGAQLLRNFLRLAKR
jgi:glutamine amidotransferase